MPRFTATGFNRIAMMSSPIGIVRRATLFPLVAVPVLFLAFPLGALVWRTIDRSGSLSSSTGEIVSDALRLSGFTTTISLALVLAFGTPMAYVLARVHFPGSRLVDLLVDLPIVLPPAVAGLALLMAFGRRGVLCGPLSDLGITTSFSMTAVIMAQCFVAAPFLYGRQRPASQLFNATSRRRQPVTGRRHGACSRT